MPNKNLLSDLTFLGGSSRLARYIGRPLYHFAAVQAAGGVLMLIATVAALVWVNSPWQDSYFDFWHTHISLSIGNYHFAHDLEHMVQDGLMTVFFFVVGLEIKRELVVGQLRDPRFAALPAVAALGGMVVPALIYLAFNSGGGGQNGWGIPMATDIAFAIGVLSLLGNRIPNQMKLFLLTLAIVDDIGAILIIAINYTGELSGNWLLTAAVLLGGILTMRQLHVWYLPAYLVVGVAFWLAVLESGVHATIAGVILGLLTPAKPLESEDDARRWANWLQMQDVVHSDDARRVEFHIRESQPVSLRIQETLHPITSYVIIPIFALSAAGVELSGDLLSDAMTSPVTLGVAIGLVAGKTVGITLFCWIAHKLGWVTIPKSLAGAHMIGVAMVAGIGFTVSLFISRLAFADDSIADESKIGILAGSLIAAVVGLLILSRTERQPPASTKHLQMETHE
ncbi:MAG: Na+/H+ antiporter NhaA [Acidimicrobiia bacterium]|nr:Na+/H+ antiporter NhaA [Acidimicrobiia bacterium]MYC57607.1 Na+/H+ antiporter NhaA [Acidimicrobiia bacterium]MYI31262.1 Na+/H+ antiporter NhaA [Acidimicrobiia bacterium]